MRYLICLLLCLPLLTGSASAAGTEGLSVQGNDFGLDGLEQAAREAEKLRKAGGEALEEQRRQLAADLADRLCR